MIRRGNSSRGAAIHCAAEKGKSLGTESHADFRHIVFSNCVVRNSRSGVAFFAKDGGVMEDVRFANIVMTTKPKWGQGFEWSIVVGISKRNANSGLSTIRDVAFSDLTVYTKGRIRASGLPDRPIENLGFRNVNVRSTGYEQLKSARPPRDGTHDYTNMPSALIFTYIKDLSLDDLTTVWPSDVREPPAPHMIYGDRLDGVSVTGFRSTASGSSLPAIRFENSTSVKQ